MSENLRGRIIAERYRLTSLLGQGGMGSVWRAEHLTLGSEVAIKLINADVAGNEEIRARFVREAKAAAGIRSPHVVQIIDYGVDGDTPYIAMELMEGESLLERLERVERLSPKETSRIITEVSRALSKAHEAGIVHRDLKPDNIFLVKNDDSEIAKVLDFGVAKQVLGTETAHMTSTGAVMGTPYYMSPEQAEGSKELDHRTDIWALAVIAYECILAARPFDAPTLGGLFLAICARDMPVPSGVSQVPVGFDEWFAQGTSRDVGLRFDSARAAAHALRLICEEGRVSSLPHTTSSGELVAPTRPAGSAGYESTQNSPGVSANSSGAGHPLNRTELPLDRTELKGAPSPNIPLNTSASQSSSGQGTPHLTTSAATSVAVPMRESKSSKALIGGLSFVGLALIAWLFVGTSETSKTNKDSLPAKSTEKGSVVSAPEHAARRVPTTIEDSSPLAAEQAPVPVKDNKNEIFDKTPDNNSRELKPSATPVSSAPITRPAVRPLPRSQPQVVAPAKRPGAAKPANTTKRASPTTRHIRTSLPTRPPAPRPRPSPAPKPAPKPGIDLGI